MAAQIRLDITAGQRWEYSNHFHALQHSLEGLEVGGELYNEVLDEATLQHDVRQGAEPLRNRFRSLVTRLRNAPTEEVVRLIFQWSN